MGHNYVSRTIIIVLLGAIPAFAFQPETQESDLAKKAFSLQELFINTAILPLDSAGTLPNRAALDRLIEKHPNAIIYLDPRSGSISNLIAAVPMIPGKGNQLTKNQVGKMLNRTVKNIDEKVVADLFRKFVADNQDSFGINARQLGPIKATQINDYLWHLHAPQVVNGLNVRRGRFLGVVNHGNLILSGSELWGNASINTKPTITAAAATKLGYEFVGGKSSADRAWKEPTLEVIPTSPPQFTKGEAFDGPIGSGYGHRLVWTFGFQRAPELARWEMGVDAHTGQVLFLADRNSYIDKKMSGGVYPLTNTFVCPTNATCGTMQPDSPMPWANTGLPAPDDFTNGAGIFNIAAPTAVATSLSGKYVHMNDTCGTINESSIGSIDLGGANGDTDCITGGSSDGNTSASRSGFYEVNKLAETARGYLPTNVWLQNQLTANMNIPSTCNAFWDGFTINFYKSGGGCRNTGEIAAVFDHEWGHGLDHNDSNATLSDSSEGYADIASMYRLWASCVGYGFFETLDQSCGQTADGTGFNNDESQLSGTQHCDTDCSGVRDADYAKHADGLPDDVNFVCNLCGGGGGGSINVPFDNAGPCGRQTHCAATPTRQAAWDFVARDLPGAGFDNNTTFIIADKLFYQGSGNIGLWHNCTCPSTSDGCGAGNAYMQWLAADDDNGNISDGTPHMVELNTAFARHAMACPTPTPANSGCEGGPTTPPTVTVEPSHNKNILTWNSVPNASSYFVFRGEGYAGCDFGKALIATVTDTTYTDNEVANGRTYSYVVMAVGSSSACFTDASSCFQAAPVPCAGVPEFTEAVYSCSDTVTLNLLDSDLAGSPSQNVTVTSNTEPAGEVVTLNATSPGSSLFSGTIGTTANSPTPDGLLSVADGDTITVTYNDVSACGPADTTSASVPVDCIAPGISNVAVQGITHEFASVHWDTTEPANSRVTYGLAPGPPGTIVEDLTSFVSSHSLDLTNLDQCSDYLFSVWSSDPAGNLTTDDNGGTFHPFTTTGVGVRLDDDLEDGGANWVAAGTPSSIWHISTCQANSGTQSFHAGNPSCIGAYPDAVLTTLTSANPIPVGPSGHGYHLTFNEFYNIEPPFDAARVQVSNNDGATWITVDSYNGQSNGWVSKDYDLSTFAGPNLLIRFTFSSDQTPSSGDGWYVDDILVRRVTPCSGNLAHFEETPIDDCSGGGPGDNDGILDPGEDITLSVTAENTGLTAVSGISAVLSTTTPGVTISNANTSFADLAPESFVVSNTPFTFNISNIVGCRSFIDFKIDYTANEGTWSDTFTMVLGGGDPVSLLAENFESGIPATWTIVDGGSGGGTAATWTADNPGERTMDPPFAGKFAITDSDEAGPFALQDEQLITPVMDASTCASLTLDFSNQFRTFSEGFTEVGDVDVSTDGGTNWTNVLSMVLDDGYPAPNTKSLDLSSIAAFQPSVQVRWHYYNGNFDFWWAIDNVNFTCTPRVCQECVQTCLFCDFFTDGTLPTDWSLKPPNNVWSEDGNNLIATTDKNAKGIAQPAFVGCSDCSFESAMKTAGGPFNGLSMYAWYVDKQNYIELLMKEEKGRWILRQRSGGAVVKKAKGLMQINPNQIYVARITFDGTNFNVFIDGTLLITMPAGAAVPSGTTGFKVKKTTGTFDYITVN